MRDDCDDGSRPHARAGWDNARANEQIRKMNLAMTLYGHTTPQNSNRVEKQDCSNRQTNPCVLIVVHAPTMVGPTASSQAAR